MATLTGAVAVRARPGTRAAAWLLITAAVVAVLFTPRFLPFYDYLEWLLQGQVMHDLWTGASVDGEPVAQLYALRPVPVPNLAAPAGIALLSFVFPTALAGAGDRAGVHGSDLGVRLLPPARLRRLPVLAPDRVRRDRDHAPRRHAARPADRASTARVPGPPGGVGRAGLRDRLLRDRPL